MSRKKTIAVTEGLLERLLAERYGAPEWVFLRQVSNGSGAAHRRTADGLALNCYPSRGMELHGFEIKVTRHDWQRELRDPDKSVPVQKFCDRWWLVISKEEFVEPGELPPTWGLMVVEVKRGKPGLKVVTPAPKLEEPERLTRAFVASVLRNAAAVVTPEAKFKEHYNAGYKDGLVVGEDTASARVRRLERESQEWRDAKSAFEDASGLRISPWTAGKMGEAVAMLTSRRSPTDVLRCHRATLAGLVSGLDAALAELGAKEAADG